MKTAIENPLFRLMMAATEAQRIERKMMNDSDIEKMSVNLTDKNTDKALKKRREYDSALKYVQTLPQVTPASLNFWASGAYVRVMPLKAGEVCAGKEHKTACVNVIAKGHLLAVNVADEFDVLEVVSGDVFVSPVGTQRLIRALEDSVWVTCHATEETDMDKIDELFTVSV